MKRITPPPFRSVDTRNGDLFTASVAWRTMENPAGGGVVMLHQRGLTTEVNPSPGGYGSAFGNGQCDSIVQTAITVVTPGEDPKTGPAMAGMVVPADMAVSADGSRVAIIAAGNATNSETPGGPPRMPRVFVTDMNSATDPMMGCRSDGQHGPCLPVGGVFSSPALGAAGASRVRRRYGDDTGAAGSAGSSGSGTR